MFPIWPFVPHFSRFSPDSVNVMPILVPEVFDYSKTGELILKSSVSWELPSWGDPYQARTVVDQSHLKSPVFATSYRPLLNHVNLENPNLLILGG